MSTARGYGRTDAANAARFAELHRYDAAYVYERGSWLVYNGTIWEPDHGQTVTMAKETAADIYREAGELDDETERKSLAKWAMASESAQRLRAMVELARPDRVVRPDEFDRNPMLLNTPANVLSLKTGKSLDHLATLFMTRCAGADYEPDAQCPRWLEFLHRITDGDQELVGYLQRAVGYSLTGRTDEQVLFLLHGSGANGKSTFLNVLLHTLGTYAQQAAFDTFLARRGDGPRTDLARLAGARFVAANESGEGRRLDEGLVKQVTGGDRIVARRLYESEVEFTPHFSLWLASNHKPEIKGTDHAIWRRIHLVPFTVRIPEDEQDPRLLDALKAESVGILRWAVEGCLAWQQHGLQPPDTVLAATEEYRSDSDILADFLGASCTVAVNARDTAKRLYAAYTAWATESGERALSQRKFGQALQERDGIAKVRSTGGRSIYHGVRVRGADDSDPSDPSLGKPPETFSGEISDPSDPYFRKPPETSHAVGLSGNDGKGSLGSLGSLGVTLLHGPETQAAPTKTGESDPSDPLIQKLSLKNARKEKFPEISVKGSLGSLPEKLLEVVDQEPETRGDAWEPPDADAGPGLEPLDPAYLDSLEGDA